MKLTIGNVTILINEPEAPCSKVRYGHKETAEKARLHMEKKKGESFDSYHCPSCGGWHIGHSRLKA